MVSLLLLFQQSCASGFTWLPPALPRLLASASHVLSACVFFFFGENVALYWSKHISTKFSLGRIPVNRKRRITNWAHWANLCATIFKLRLICLSEVDSNPSIRNLMSRTTEPAGDLSWVGERMRLIIVKQSDYRIHRRKPWLRRTVSARRIATPSGLVWY